MATEPLSSGGRSHAAAARIARAVYRRDEQEEADARRDFAAHKIAEAIDRALSTAPPLSPSQLRSLSALLRGGQR